MVGRPANVKRRLQRREQRVFDYLRREIGDRALVRYPLTVLQVGVDREDGVVVADERPGAFHEDACVRKVVLHLLACGPPILNDGVAGEFISFYPRSKPRDAHRRRRLGRQGARIIGARVHRVHERIAVDDLCRKDIEVATQGEIIARIRQCDRRRLEVVEPRRQQFRGCPGRNRIAVSVGVRQAVTVGVGTDQVDNHVVDEAAGDRYMQAVQPVHARVIPGNGLDAACREARRHVLVVILSACLVRVRRGRTLGYVVANLRINGDRVRPAVLVAGIRRPHHHDAGEISRHADLSVSLTGRYRGVFAEGVKVVFLGDIAHLHDGVIVALGRQDAGIVLAGRDVPRGEVNSEFIFVTEDNGQCITAVEGGPRALVERAEFRDELRFRPGLCAVRRVGTQDRVVLVVVLEAQPAGQRLLAEIARRNADALVDLDAFRQLRTGPRRAGVKRVRAVDAGAVVVVVADENRVAEVQSDGRDGQIEAIVQRLARVGRIGFRRDRDGNVRRIRVQVGNLEGRFVEELALFCTEVRFLDIQVLPRRTKFAVVLIPAGNVNATRFGFIAPAGDEVVEQHARYGFQVRVRAELLADRGRVGKVPRMQAADPGLAARHRDAGERITNIGIVDAAVIVHADCAPARVIRRARAVGFVELHERVADIPTRAGRRRADRVDVFLRYCLGEQVAAETHCQQNDRGRTEPATRRLRVRVLESFQFIAPVGGQILLFS